MRRSDEWVVSISNFVLWFASAEYKIKLKATILAGMEVLKDEDLTYQVQEKIKKGRPVPKGNLFKP